MNEIALFEPLRVSVAEILDDVDAGVNVGKEAYEYNKKGNYGRIRTDLCFKGNLFGDNDGFSIGIVEFKTTSTLPFVKPMKSSILFQMAVGQSYLYSVDSIKYLAGLIGWKKLEPILEDYHVDHAVVTPEVVILCRLGFKNFDEPLFYTHSEKVFEKDERARVFSLFLQKQKEICNEISRLEIKKRESKYCWLPLPDNVKNSPQEIFKECGTSNSNIWKAGEYYYKRVNESAQKIYYDFMQHHGKFVVESPFEYFIKIPNYGRRIEKKDINNGDNETNTIEIFIDLVEQLEDAFEMNQLCHRDIRLPNIVFKDSSKSATLIDWDYAKRAGAKPSAIFSTFLDYDKEDVYKVVPERDLYALSCLALWGMTEDDPEPDSEPDADVIDWKEEYRKYEKVEHPPILFNIAKILREPYDDYKEKLKYNRGCHKDVIKKLRELKQSKKDFKPIFIRYCHRKRKRVSIRSSGEVNQSKRKNRRKG